EKLPADRFESARTFAEALGDPTFTTPTTRVVSGVARARDRWRRLAVGLAAVAVVATVASVWRWLRPVARDVDQPVVEFYLDPPDATMSFVAHLALSPDGRRLVAEVDTDEGRVLYQRMLDARDWRIIPGTEGAYDPFFSPDGEWLGFFSSREGAIKRVPVEGGSAQTIAQVDWISGASWGPDNSVVFSTVERASGVPTAGLFRVSADGGVPERLTTPDIALGEAAHVQPHYLPSGEVVLFMAHGRQPVVAALSLESGTVSRLTPGMAPRSDRAGRVVYVTSEGVAVAQTFNPRTLALEGSPRPIAEGIASGSGLLYAASYTVSSDGSLAYLSEPDRGDQLLLVSREGETRVLFSPGGGSRLWTPRFSPSGDRIAFVRDEDVWVYSLAEGTAQRLSFEGPSTDPAWTTDGRSIGYSVAGEGDGSFATLLLRAADGTGSAEQILVGDDELWQMDFAPGDSEVVIYSMFDVFRASLGSDSGPVPLMETEYFVEHPTLSPDGRWLAYKSNESGINEVYVRSYPDMGSPTVVSIGGGSAPAWSADGSEIFYWGRSWGVPLDPNPVLTVVDLIGSALAGDTQIMAASVRYDGSRVTVVERAELFRAGSFQRHWNRNYDVHPNRQEFVMVGGTETRVVWRVNALASER
ncbi:MAG: PD40 domain-containing protein, partial [Gemmatimonadota bacterium]